MSKLKTVWGIFRRHEPGLACALCAGILCRRFSYRGPFGTINLALLKLAFNDAAEALRTLGIPFVLAYGTALGIRRGGELLKHDDDLDFVVFQNALARLSPDSVERDKIINRTLDRYAFKPRAAGLAPAYYAPRHWHRADHVPLIYQYLHHRTNVSLDIYVFGEHDGFYWHHQGRGKRWPMVPMNRVNYSGNQYMIFPDQWLTLKYGDWRTPKRKGQYPSGPNANMRPAGGIPPFRSGVSCGARPSPEREEASEPHFQ